MSEWIKVEDRLPEKTTVVLVFVNDIVNSWIDVANCYICPEYGNAIFEDLSGEDYVPIVTHWMQLPDRPVEPIV